MGTSFTDFDGKGFWTSDSKLELWLFSLTQQVQEMASVPLWLATARDHWLVQATGGFMGCVDAGLDDFLGDDGSRIELVRQLGHEAKRQLHIAPSVPRSLLSSYLLGGAGSGWTKDLDPALMDPVAKAFDELLAGTLTTDASTSLVV